MENLGSTHPSRDVPNRPRGRRLLLNILLPGAFLGFALAGCGILGPEEDSDLEPKPGQMTVLFIGSSYLEFNDVPKRFQELAAKAGHDVFVKSHTILGRPLAVHAASSEAAYVIRKHDWDYVVLQGGAQDVAYPRGADHPVLPALRELHRKATEDSPGTRVVWMMPWAYEDGMLWIEGRTEDYAQMQLDIRDKVLEWIEDVDLVVAPVGMAFYEVLTEWDPGPHFLHDLDWNHASQEGSFLAAATFFSTIFAEGCADVEYRWKVERELAEDLREVASHTVLDDLELWRIGGGGAGGGS
jgi:hypothetical protein